MGKCRSSMAENFLAMLVLTSSFHGGLNQVTFLFLVLFLVAGFSMYWSCWSYPASISARWYTGASAVKTFLFADIYTYIDNRVHEPYIKQATSDVLIYKCGERYEHVVHVRFKSNAQNQWRVSVLKRNQREEG